MLPVGVPPDLGVDGGDDDAGHGNARKRQSDCIVDGLARLGGGEASLLQGKLAPGLCVIH